MSLLAVAGANSASGAYEITNSLKLEADNSENLYRDLNASTSTTKFTHSMWVKRTELTNAQLLYMRGVAGNEATLLRFSGESGYEHGLQIDIGGSSTNARSVTNRKFRDPHAWYHIVLAVDTTQSTAANRRRLYINGVEETDFGMNNTPSQNFAMEVSSAKHRYGAYNDTDNYAPFSGYIAECHYIDGSQLDASSFGESDEDSGIWIPKQYTGSYGTGGYYLKFNDSSALGNNSAGDGTDFTLRNIAAADQATDTPSNNFTIFNCVRRYNADALTIRDGGTTIKRSSATNWSTAFNTFAVNKGKWYWEGELYTNEGIQMFGQTPQAATEININIDWYLGKNSDKSAGAGYYGSGEDVYYEGGYVNSSASTTGDIISVAMDCDNNKVHFAVNGVYTNSSDPANNTNGFAMTDEYQYFAMATYNGSQTYRANFGGYTTISISSAASDANGYGTFEYAPPSGYYALCTKNLAEYG